MVRPPSARISTSALSPSGLRQLGVVEPHPQARLTQRQAQAQEEEQAGQADPVRDPGRHDRGDHHRRAHQQDEAEVTCLHGCLRMAVPGPELVVTSLPDQRSPTHALRGAGALRAVQERRYSERCFSQSSTSWATSRQPWSIVSE